MLLTKFIYYYFLFSIFMIYLYYYYIITCSENVNVAEFFETPTNRKVTPLVVTTHSLRSAVIKGQIRSFSITTFTHRLYFGNMRRLLFYNHDYSMTIKTSLYYNSAWVFLTNNYPIDRLGSVEWLLDLTLMDKVFSRKPRQQQCVDMIQFIWELFQETTIKAGVKVFEKLAYSDQFEY